MVADTTGLGNPWLMQTILPVNLKSSTGRHLLVNQVSSQASEKCLNCNGELLPQQQYCAICGQKRIHGRLTLHDIGHDLVHALIHVDRSALSLILMLLTRPGYVARDYIEGKRKRYFGPFAFLFVVVAAASAAIALTGFRTVSAGGPSRIADFVQSHINLFMFAEVPILAVYSRLFDGKKRFTFTEHLVLATYTTSFRVVVFSLLMIPAWLFLHLRDSTSSYLFYSYVALGPFYFGFASAQFLEGSPALSWVKGIAAAILTWLSLQALVSLAASLWIGLQGLSSMR